MESWESIAFGFLGYTHTQRDRHESAIKLATASSSENGSACNLIYFNCSRIITTGDKVPLQPQQFHSLPLSPNLFPPLSFSHISLSVKLFINKFWSEETKRSKRQFQLNRHALPLPRPPPLPLFSVQFAHEMKMLLLLLMLPPTGQPSSGSCVCCLTTIATASKLAPNLQLSGRNAPPA